MELYTLAIAHDDGPAAEIFTSERAALARRLELSEVSDRQREELLHLFDSENSVAYESALNRLESECTLVCGIEPHELDLRGSTAADPIK
jgi:hypothetical protein